MRFHQQCSRFFVDGHPKIKFFLIKETPLYQFFYAQHLQTHPRRFKGDVIHFLPGWAQGLLVDNFIVRRFLAAILFIVLQSLIPILLSNKFQIMHYLQNLSFSFYRESIILCY